MANVLTGYTWVLDTPGLIWSSQVWIIEVYWKNPATPGDIFILTDNAGRVIVDGRCETANQSQVWKPNRWFNGLTLAVLNSGTLEITIK